MTDFLKLQIKFNIILYINTAIKTTDFISNVNSFMYKLKCLHSWELCLPCCLLISNAITITLKACSCYSSQQIGSSSNNNKDSMATGTAKMVNKAKELIFFHTYHS